ncbi:MAG: C45 family autoproteolytic acyltransferase/hydrolase [Coprothermobacterota bacterium]|nr:C45 family autoproteolytic acyltransferase/hydrolase [Coprothermobacterota bacterium]
MQGDPYQRGLQHGYLLAGEIVEAIRVRDALLQMDMGLTFAEVSATAAEMYGPMLDQEIRQEMQGIADGVNLGSLEAPGEELTFEEVLGWNSLIDLSTMWAVNTSGSSLNDHCSAFIATGSYTQDGEIVMGHNSWADYAGFAVWRVMLDLRPEQGHRIVMQSAPGLVWSGSDYFISDAGLVGCETTFFNWQRFDSTGLPVFLRTRWAMQYADSIDRFVEILNDRNNGGYANGWLLGDVRTNEIARFEQGLAATRLDRTVDGYYAGYNAAEDPAIQAESGGWNADDPSNFSGARRIRWGQLLEANKGSLDSELGMTMLGDHYDTWLEREEPSSRTLCGHYEQYGAPCGAMDGKVTNSQMARQMSTWARWGLPCGMAFDAEQAIAVNPGYGRLEGLLTDLPSQNWTIF